MFRLFRKRMWIALLVGFVFAPSIHASTALLLEEPFGLFGRMNPTGHAAIYLDHICANPPTHLRPCRPGELGSVISRYHRVDGYDWVAIPLVPYLYAVENLNDVPETASLEIEADLRDSYRRAHLLHIAPNKHDGSTPKGEWIQLVGSAYDRKIYGFQLASTPEQDAALIAHFNASKNISHFNLLFRNCADFSRKLINRQYPGAIRRNFIADFGLTTPKQVARSIQKYAAKHPEVKYSTFIIPQVDGSIRRSRRVDGIAEALVRSKKYVIPLALLTPITTGFVGVAWLTGGRMHVPTDAPMLQVLDRRHLHQQPLRRVAGSDQEVVQKPAESVKVENEQTHGETLPVTTAE